MRQARPSRRRSHRCYLAFLARPFPPCLSRLASQQTATTSIELMSKSRVPHFIRSITVADECQQRSLQLRAMHKRMYRTSAGTCSFGELGDHQGSQASM